jgi:hypothetical protein
MNSDGLPSVVRVRETTRQSRLGVRTKVRMDQAALASRTLGCQNVSGQGTGFRVSDAFIIGRWGVNGTSIVR